MLTKINLLEKAQQIDGWKGETIAELEPIGSRLFRLTPEKEMVIFEEGHTVNEWLLVLKGEVHVETDSAGSIVLEEGDSFIVPPGINHQLNVKDKEAICLITRDMEQAPLHAVPGAVTERKR